MSACFDETEDKASNNREAGNRTAVHTKGVIKRNIQY